MTTAPPGLTLETPAGLGTALVFAALLAAACVTDARERRIPNRLVALLLAAGLARALAAAVAAGTLNPLGTTLAACALGFAVWVPFYALRMLGAGDVKLFAAAAAWLAPGQVLEAALYASLFGGALAVLWLFLEYGTAYGLFQVAFMYHRPLAALRAGRVGGDARRHIPYGIAMALGLSLAVWLSRPA